MANFISDNPAIQVLICANRPERLSGVGFIQRSVCCNQSPTNHLRMKTCFARHRLNQQPGNLLAAAKVLVHVSSDVMFYATSAIVHLNSNEASRQ